MERRILLKIYILLLISVCLAKKKIDLGFVVDDWSTSPSLNTKNGRIKNARAGEHVKDLIRTIYGSFGVEDGTAHVGLVKSGATAEVVFDFNTKKDLDGLDEAIEELTIQPKSAQSNIGKALDLANYGLFKNSGRPDALKFLVVVAQTKSTDDVSRAARDLRNSGVNIVSAWSGNQNSHRDDLQSIVSPPKHYNLFRDGGSSVDTLAPLIVKRIRYVASTSSLTRPVAKSNSKQQSEGNKCSKRCDVKVKGGERIKIDCSNCKLVACCDRCCKNDYNQPFYPGPVELAIVLDDSGELKNLNNFNLMKSFIKKLTREFELSNKKTKIGLISFTDTNLQLFDLHSYHDNKNIDHQIDKLNYEGSKANSGALNKALDAAQSNLFTEERDLGVPRLMLVFDSATKKDDETETKAFKLKGTDVQTFCIGLGTSYDKSGCNKIVEKPYKSHSLSAQVAYLGELQEAIMLMIIKDIGGKYCPLCAQGTNDACKPCKIARRYRGSDESKSPQKIHSSKPLKLIDQGDGQEKPLKVELKLADGDENDDDARLGSGEAVKLLGGSQVGTPLPSAEVVKELLQSGTALNPDANSQAPLIANDQSLLQKSPALVQPTMIQQPLQPQQFVQQELLQQQQQQNQQQQQQNLNSLLPQLTPLATPVDDNQKFTPPLLKSAPITPALISQDRSTNSPLTLQSVVLNPSLLSQAILGNGELQRQQAEKSAATQVVSRENGPESSSLSLGALSTLPVQDSDSTNKIASSHENAEMTSSLPVAQLSPTDVDVSKATQFQSSMELPQSQHLPARKTNWFDFPPASVANKKSPFGDEYKYDVNDQEGPFVMECKDLADECPSYATEGGCDDFAPLSSIGEIKIMCKKSCGFCESNAGIGHKKSQTKQTRAGHRIISAIKREKLHQ